MQIKHVFEDFYRVFKKISVFQKIFLEGTIEFENSEFWIFERWPIGGLESGIVIISRTVVRRSGVWTSALLSAMLWTSKSSGGVSILTDALIFNAAVSGVITVVAFIASAATFFAIYWAVDSSERCTIRTGTLIELANAIYQTVSRVTRSALVVSIFWAFGSNCAGTMKSKNCKLSKEVGVFLISVFYDPCLESICTG